MIYILKGEEPIFITNKLNELLDNDNEKIKFDGSNKDFNSLEMLDACQANSLFANNTSVVVKDPPFLCKKVDDKEANLILDYINNPLYDTDLIFYTLENKFNSKLKLYKDISNNCQIISFDSMKQKDFNTYCYSRLNEVGLKLNREIANYLIDICKRDASLFEANIKVLLLYPDSLDINVIKSLCTASEDDVSFDLINAITNKDISKVISLQRSLCNDSNDSIIYLLAKQLRTLYHIRYLKDKGYSKQDISSETGINENRLYYIFMSIDKLSSKQMLAMLYELSNLDILSKSDTSISLNSRFETFVLNMLKKESNVK